MPLFELLKEIDQLGSKCSKPQDFRAELESVNQTAKETVFSGHNAISPHELRLLEKIVDDIKLEHLDSEPSFEMSLSYSKFKLLMRNDMLRILAKTFFEQRPELIAWYYSKLLLTADADEKLLDEIVLLFDLAPDALILAVRDDSYAEAIILKVQTIFADQFEIFVRKLCAPEVADMRLLLALTEVYSLSFVQQSNVPSLQFLINALIAPREGITPEFRAELLRVFLTQGLAQHYIAIASREKDKKTVVAMINFMLESLKIMPPDEDGFEIVAGEHDVQSPAALAELFAQLLDEQAMKKTFAGSEMPLFDLLRAEKIIDNVYVFFHSNGKFDPFLMSHYPELCRASEARVKERDNVFRSLVERKLKEQADLISAQETQLIAVTHQHATVEQFLPAFRAEAADAAARCKELGQTVLQLSEDVDAKNVAHKKEVLELRTKITAAEADNLKLKEDVADGAQKAAELRKKDRAISGIQKARALQAQQVTQFEQQIKLLTQQLAESSAMDEQVGQLEQQIELLTQQLKDSSTKKDEQVGQLEQQVSDLTQQLQESSTQAEQVGQLEQQVSTLTAELDHLKRTDRLTATLESAKQQILELQASVAPVVPGAAAAQSPTQLQSSTAAVAPPSRLRVTAPVFQPSSSASDTDACPGFVVSSSESGSELDESAASAMEEHTGSEVYSSASGAEAEEVYVSDHPASDVSGQPDAMFDSKSSEYTLNFPRLS
jgi:hypothetical protein